MHMYINCHLLTLWWQDSRSQSKRCERTN